MSTENIAFPIYRKFVGINVWFKIIDDKNFMELKQLGTKFLLHEVKAVQYPEMILIKDMIECLDGRWEEVKPDFFEENRPK